jgi:peptide/nickel transport system ATP-binding protein/oligopeptide transport system ATP-binding protein
MRDRRGRDLAMIFQDPLSSLNPVVSIGIQVTEVLERHRGMKRSAAMHEARDLLESVGIPDPNRRLKEYPHQMSGGMRQRALIAMALACRPRLLIADEPTTALDVTIQAQILDLMMDLRDEFGMAIIIITHNMGVVAETADRVLVMYAGRIVEEAPVARLFDHPLHPYTRGLLECVPSLDQDHARLVAIQGTLPDPARRPAGCRFSPRCRHAVPACTSAIPPLETFDPGHTAACIRVAEFA